MPGGTSFHSIEGGHASGIEVAGASAEGSPKVGEETMLDRRRRGWVLPEAARLQAAARLADFAAGRLPAAYAAGLKNCEFPGRAQVVVVPACDLPTEDPRTETAQAQTEVAFFLDGAHTPASMLSCARWFSDASARATAGQGGEVERVLLFNCMTTRQPRKLLAPLLRGFQKNVSIQHACFVPQESQYSSLKPVEGPKKDVSWQRGEAEAWEDLQGEAGVLDSGSAAFCALRSTFGKLFLVREAPLTPEFHVFDGPERSFSSYPCTHEYVHAE